MRKILIGLFLLFTMAHMDLFGQDGSFSFEKAWNKVDSLEKKDLTRSALETVESIYAAADKEQQDAQLIKALVHVMKLHDRIEEKSDSLNLERIRAELKKAQFPRKQILHSLMGDMFYTYYQGHRWELHDRTAARVELEDFQTWDATTLFQESSRHYLASLEPADELQQQSISDFTPIILRQKESARYRPTLYDLLAHRAISFFNNTATDLAEPVYKFELNVNEGLAPVEAFISQSFETRDSNSRVYQAIKIYQQLLAFHSADEEPYAFIDADLKRLAYAKEKAVGPEKSPTYLKALRSLEAAHQQHPAVPDVQYEIAKYFNSEANSYVPLESDEHQWDRKTALDICDQAIKSFPTSRGAINCGALRSQIVTRSLNLTAEAVNLSKTPFRMRMQFRNLDQTWFRVIRITDKLQKKLEKIRYYEQDKRLALMLREPALEQWSMLIPNEGDFQSHATEIRVPGLEYGEYFVLASDNAKFGIKQHAVAYTQVRVSDMTCLEQSLGDQHHYYLLHRFSGEALPGIQATEYVMNQKDRTYKPSGKIYTTDENGHILASGQKKGSRYHLKFQSGADKLTTSTHYMNGYRERTPVPHPRVVFFLDRKIYRPGQTVYFKGLMMRQSGQEHEIWPNAEAKVKFLDANYQEISELVLQTNEYGTFSGTFVAPTSGLLGRMQLQTEGGNTDFSVEEYKRPKFEVTIDKVEGSYQLNDTVLVKGHALAFTGASIDGAEVRYRVVREARFPFWYSYFWWRPMPRKPPMEILNGTSTTDAKGDFEIEFPALEDKTVSAATKPVFHYTVYADVVDITGETRSSSQSVRIGQIGMTADISVPGLISTKSIPTFALTTNNLNGKYVPAIGTIKIIRLTDPGITFRSRRWAQADTQIISKRDYRKDFPFDIYANEQDFRNWEVGAPSLIRSFDTEESKELSIPEISKLKPGKFKLELKTEDAFGNEILVIRYFTLNDPEDKTPSLTSLLTSQLSPASVEPGETAALLLGTTEKSLPLIYQVVKGQEVIEQLHLNLRKGQETISIPVPESWRGNVSILIAYARHNEMKIEQKILTVPWSNKELKLEWMTFRSELQPGQADQWKLKISGPKAEAVSAEMVAAMYDASLDEFRSNSFALSLYPNRYNRVRWNGIGFGTQNSNLVEKDWNPRSSPYSQGYDQLNWFDFRFGAGYRLQEMMVGAAGGGPVRSSRARPSRMASAPKMSAAPMEDSAEDFSNANPVMEVDGAKNGQFNIPEATPMEEMDDEASTIASADTEAQKQNLDAVAIRTNLNETAFFFPHMETNEAGEILIDFTVPEALTKWKFIGLAHTKDLKIGTLSGETVTKKDLMVVPNVPRFLREGDQITFTAKVVNLSDSTLTGEARLDLLDAFSMKEVNSEFGIETSLRTFTVEAGQSSLLAWDLQVPQGAQAIATRVIAKAGEFSDGEENVLPVLSNRMLVTESMPLPIRGKGKKTFDFKKLINSGDSPTLTHQKLTLEFTSNPAWYAVQALPYLMEYPHDCTEQIFSRFYANALATHIANSSPKIQQVFKQWRNQAVNDVAAKQTLLSNLEKNQELKSVLLQETPWVLNARDESERKQRVGLLFDLNRMADELGRARQKLSQLQHGSGAFSWFPGMRESRYITNLVVSGMGHLTKLGVGYSGDPEIAEIITKALPYLDGQLAEDHRQLKRYTKDAGLKENHLGTTQINYLYMRSFFNEVPVSSGAQAAFAYYYGQAKEFWPQQSNYMKGMLALTFERNQDHAIAEEVVASLKENAVFNEEQGMYWKSNKGYYWYQAPIETQAMLIEAFEDITNDIESVEAMKVWLLKNKQTNDWKTTRATVAACNALLATGINVLESNELVEVSLGGEKIDPFEREDTRVEAGTGYFKTAWVKEEVKPKMGNVTIRKKDRGVAWGAMYWQYFEDLDKITYAQTPLSIRKELFIEKPSDTGPILEPITEGMPLQPGDKVKVRVELRVDRDMEYVHMKDMRAAGFEPINVFSTYKYQGGLGYYESTKDAATHFFFDRLPKGTWVFEYPLRVNHAGDFSNGITTIQCMYAPEFTSHSAGIRVQVEAKE